MMAVDKKEIMDWLNSLPEGTEVGIDDGGMILHVVGDPKPYLEIGGIPEDEDD